MTMVIIGMFLRLGGSNTIPEPKEIQQNTARLASSRIIFYLDSVAPMNSRSDDNDCEADDGWNFEDDAHGTEADRFYICSFLHGPLDPFLILPFVIHI